MAEPENMPPEESQPPEVIAHGAEELPACGIDNGVCTMRSAEE